MTDHLDAEAADARAENAFRTAFEQKAQVSPPGGFDGAAIRRKSRTRSTGLVAATAAAVLILCGGLVSAVQLTRDSAPSSTTAAEPYAGWRFEFYRDVRLQVPDSWGYADEPGGDWCAAVPGGMIPKQPYVARAEAYLFRLGIGCSEPGTPLYRRPPINTWVDHVTLKSGPGQAGVQRVGQFWVITKPVGHVSSRWSPLTENWPTASWIQLRPLMRVTRVATRAATFRPLAFTSRHRRLT